MKERLPQLERLNDSLRGVLRAASRTRTLVFNEVKRLAGEPDTLINVGLGFIAGGLTAGVSGFLAATTMYSFTSKEMLSEVLFDAGYIGVCGGLGISLIVRGRRAHL